MKPGTGVRIALVALLLVIAGGVLVLRPGLGGPATAAGPTARAPASGAAGGSGLAAATSSAAAAGSVAGAASGSGLTSSGASGASGTASPASASSTAGAASSAPGSSGASPSAAAGVTAAPTSAVKFDPRHTTVPILFPLLPTAKYGYQAFWREPRLGVVYPYNQIRGVAPDGTLLRAHDGVDITAAIGTIVVAPFAGVIVDPARFWKPWDPQRYGNVIVVQSTESTSLGYRAILVHLSRKSVVIGQVVKRGQVVGRTGITGNAEGTVPHLHFELHAPFLIAFHYAGVLRYLDGFDPLPSLQAADPHRH